MKIYLIIFYLIFQNVFAQTEVAVHSKTFEELVKSGVLLKAVPKQIQGIWHGRLVLTPYEGEDQIEIIDMCNYPFRNYLKIKSQFQSNFKEAFELSGIRKYDRTANTRTNPFNILLYTFHPESKKLLTGATSYRYDKTSDLLTQERHNPDEKEPYWKMEYEREKCK